MKELVIISGKGGTGKTSLAASLAVLAENAVLADCDVDAADLHLVLEPAVLQQEEFSGGSRAEIKPELCTACGKCEELCRFDAIRCDDLVNGHAAKVRRVDPIACEGCGVCAWFCDANAVEFAPAVNGQWFISDTRCGPIVHAELRAAEANSGKLVSLVRAEARKIAETQKLDLVLVDGAPGIGCPVIASVGGADMVLVVTEPTLSGMHDLDRVTELTRHFGVETVLGVNKWDLNKSMTESIEAQAAERGLKTVGRVRYDHRVTEAQIMGLSVVEYADEGVSEDIKNLWHRVRALLDTTGEE